MADLPPPQFRKTKNTDKWAVMGPVATLEEALAADGRVQVQKKNGDWSSFTIKSLGKAFDVDGVQMCYGYADEAESGQTGAGQAGGYQGGQQGGYSNSPPPPPRDESEPIPEYQGGPDDEWGYDNDSGGAPF